MRKKSLLKSKKGKARATAVRKEWARIKRGKMTPEEELRYSYLLKKKKGFFLETRIGLKNVYKYSFGSSAKLNTIQGYETLKKHNIPVTKFKGKKIIRGRERLVFEKGREMKTTEFPKYIDEILKIIEKTARNGIIIDPTMNNFGVNKEGKVVIIDTNHIFIPNTFKYKNIIKKNGDRLVRNLRYFIEKDKKTDRKLIRKVQRWQASNL